MNAAPRSIQDPYRRIENAESQPAELIDERQVLRAELFRVDQIVRGGSRGSRG